MIRQAANAIEAAMLSESEEAPATRTRSPNARTLQPEYLLPDEDKALEEVLGFDPKRATHTEPQYEEELIGNG